MTATLQALKSLVAGDGIFRREMFAGVKLNALLDERDGPPFDDEWVRVTGW